MQNFTLEREVKKQAKVCTVVPWKRKEEEEEKKKKKN